MCCIWPHLATRIGSTLTIVPRITYLLPLIVPHSCGAALQGVRLPDMLPHVKRSRSQASDQRAKRLNDWRHTARQQHRPRFQPFWSDRSTTIVPDGYGEDPAREGREDYDYG